MTSKKKSSFVVRYSNTIIIGSGVIVTCNLGLWLAYWLTQPGHLLHNGVIIFPFALIPMMIFLYYLYWHVNIVGNTIIIFKLFRKKQKYHSGQIDKMTCYLSGAERGTVIWIHFQNGKWLKVSHSMKNFERMHSYLLQKGTIEWR